MNNFIIKTHPIIGKCVFTDRKYKQGEFIVLNHVIPVKIDSCKFECELHNYLMDWTEEYDCISLGIINLINHSVENRNCTTINDYENKTKTLFATKNIDKDEELLFDYDCELWFEPI
jgi:hypothetical protein